MSTNPLQRVLAPSGLLAFAGLGLCLLLIAVMGLRPIDNPSILADSVNSAGHFFVFGLLALLAGGRSGTRPAATQDTGLAAAGHRLRAGRGCGIAPGTRAATDPWSNLQFERPLAGHAGRTGGHLPAAIAAFSSQRSLRRARRPLDEPGIAGQRHDSGLRRWRVVWPTTAIAIERFHGWWISMRPGRSAF